jgi:hypothetical protein
VVEAAGVIEAAGAACAAMDNWASAMKSSVSFFIG